MDTAQLRPPSLLLQIVGAPFFLLVAIQSRQVQKELRARYCRPCRRQLNVLFFFVAFATVMIALMFWTQ